MTTLLIFALVYVIAIVPLVLTCQWSRQLDEHTPKPPALDSQRANNFTL